jgi:hypothetical protein
MIEIISINMIRFSKILCAQNLCFSVYLLSQCMLGPFIHMTQRKYVTIIWWPIHVLSMLYRSWYRKITISEIFTGVLCTVGGTLVEYVLGLLHEWSLRQNISMSTNIFDLVTWPWCLSYFLKKLRPWLYLLNGIH